MYQPAKRLNQGSIETTFVSWQGQVLASAGGGSCSPNLLELRRRLEQRWPGWKTLGCYAPRSVRGSTSPSSHAFGAAIDLSWERLGRIQLLDEVIPWLIGWSRPWHLQAIHDYVGCRIWRAGRTADVNDSMHGWWKPQTPDKEGMGKSWASWIHLEVTPDGWGDARHWDERGSG